MSVMEALEAILEASDHKSLAMNNSLISTLGESARDSSPYIQRPSGRCTPAITTCEFLDLPLSPGRAPPLTCRASNTGPLWNQSPSTWRHTSYKYSFSKDSRFKNSQASHLDIQKLQLPSTMRSKSCTFGKGQRKPISTVKLRNAKNTPSPDRYDLSGFLNQTRQASKGKTFGLPWQAYKQVYIKHRKDVYSGHFVESHPEAIYDVRETPGKDKHKFSIYGRLKMFNEQFADQTRMNPGPVHEIKESLVKNNVGLNQRNFGFGERIDLAKPANSYPAPNAYNLKGFCARFKPK